MKYAHYGSQIGSKKGIPINRESISYWQSTAPDIPLELDLPRTIDVAVIGGGLLGTATSYWLAREGNFHALLERKAIGAGATGRNGGKDISNPTALACTCDSS